MKSKVQNVLRECPFCGGEVKRIISPYKQTVMFVCEKCGADVCFYGAEHEPKATQAWNSRNDDKSGKSCNNCVFYYTCSKRKRSGYCDKYRPTIYRPIEED